MKISNQIMIGLTIVGCLTTCKNRGDSQYEKGLKSASKGGGFFGTSESDAPTDSGTGKGGTADSGTTGGDTTTTGGGDLTTGSTTGTTTGTTTGSSTTGTASSDEQTPPPLDCTKDTAIVDANATFAWTGILRAGDDIDRYINTIDKVLPKMRRGALRYSAENATFVCNLRGFASGTLTAKGSFQSPSDNSIYQWNSTTKRLDVANAATSNVTMRGISCKGKLDDRCVQDRTWLLGP